MCVTDRHDITLAVKVTLNPDTINQVDHNLTVAKMTEFALLW